LESLLVSDFNTPLFTRSASGGLSLIDYSASALSSLCWWPCPQWLSTGGLAHGSWENNFRMSIGYLGSSLFIFRWQFMQVFCCQSTRGVETLRAGISREFFAAVAGR